MSEGLSVLLSVLHSLTQQLACSTASEAGRLGSEETERELKGIRLEPRIFVCLQLCVWWIRSAWVPVLRLKAMVCKV